MKSCLAILFCFAASAVSVDAAQRPNIVLIVADDLGEQYDLSKQKPQRVQSLTGAWTTWEIDVTKVPRHMSIELAYEIFGGLNTNSF